MQTHTRAPIRSTCICCLCVFCLLGELLTWCQVEPALQNLCDHLLLPLWPSDTQIYTTTYVCMYKHMRILLTAGSYSVCAASFFVGDRQA